MGGRIVREGLMISTVPGRKGRYLVILKEDGLHVVARLVGVTEERQQRSLDVFLAWVETFTGEGFR